MGESGRVAVVILSFNGGQDLQRLLTSCRNQEGPFDYYVVDSSSTDGSLEYVANCDLITDYVVIAPTEFNHGGTRQMMFDRYPAYDLYIYLTQDAYPETATSFMELISFFRDDEVGAVCGRQLPHKNANAFGAHARHFSYPKDSAVKAISDIPSLGLKVAFLSNSFSAYRREALVSVGGFPSDVILAEDMYVAARMALAGWKVAYAGTAAVHHSHNYSLAEECRRYFDIGVFHAHNPWIRERFGGAGGEGLKFVKSELSYLRHQIHLWPLSLLRNAGKLFFYKLGQKEGALPMWLKKRISMHRRYWGRSIG